MAVVFKIKSIKDNTGGSDGSIKDNTGGSDGSVATTRDTTSTVSIDPIKDSTGGSDVAITIVNSRTGKEYVFSQYFFKELCLNEGDNVRVQFVEGRDASGKETMVVDSVSRVTVGTVTAVDAGGKSGTITEKDTTNSIRFYQSNAIAVGIQKGDFVRYDLIRASNGEIIAVNVMDVRD